MNRGPKQTAAPRVAAPIVIRFEFTRGVSTKTKALSEFGKRISTGRAECRVEN